MMRVLTQDSVEYVKRAGNEWKIAGDGVFVRDVEENPTSESKNDGNDERNNTTLSVRDN